MGLRLGISSGQKATEARTEEELSRLITHLTNEIDWYMRARKLTRADLAGLMGVSPGRVSQILSGGENLTLRTLAGVASALDAHFDLELKPHQPVADPVHAVEHSDASQVSASQVSASQVSASQVSASHVSGARPAYDALTEPARFG